MRLRSCRVNLHTGEIQRDKKRQELSVTERRLLLWFHEHPGEAVSRELLLNEVWGYTHGVVSRTIDTTMRRLRRKLEQDPSQPGHFHTVRGVGYRFTPLLASAPPLPSPDLQTSTRLPSPLTALIGRQESLARLEALLGRRRLITITGPGGVGKTRLMLAAGHRQRGRFSDVLFCDLSTVDDEEGVMAVLGEVLALSGAPSTAAAHRALQDRHRPLLLLDNAEHILPILVPMVAAVLQAVAALIVIVTSRQRLHIRGEALLELAPLSRPEALELLAERIIDATGYPPPPEQTPTLTQLVEALDRLPLAIELAAARMDTMTAREALDQLVDRFTLLRSQWVDVSDRQATLWGTLEWSWSRLSPAEQIMLSRVALVRSRFTQESARVLFNAAPIPDADPLQLLYSLRQKSLLQQEDDQFRLLEAVRDFALQHHPAQRARVAVAWGRWLVEETESWFARCYSHPTETLAWIRAVQSDLLAIWERHQEDAPELAARALIPLRFLINTLDPTNTLVRRLRKALTMELPDGVRSGLHHALALFIVNHHHEEAVGHAREAMALAPTPRQRLLAGCTLASILSFVDEQRRLVEELMQYARDVGGDAMLETILQQAQGMMKADHTLEAALVLEDGIAYSRTNGWPLHEASLSRMLGLLRSREGQNEAATALLRTSARIYAHHGRQISQAWVLNNLGIFYLERNRNRAAEAQFREALRLLRRTGAAGISAVITNLAAVHHQRLELPQARALYQEAMVDIAQTGRPYEVVLTEINLAALEVDAGDLEAADRHLLAAEPLLNAQNSSWLWAIAASARSSARLLQRRYHEALEAALLGVDAARAANDLRMEVSNLNNGAMAHLLAGRPEHAYTLLQDAWDKITIQGDTHLRASVGFRVGIVQEIRGQTDHHQPYEQSDDVKRAAAIYQGEPLDPIGFESRLAALIRQLVPG
ncbi:MAG: winged helix-turn-helix domain-containing protein [Myxococcota bacterium]